MNFLADEPVRSEKKICMPPSSNLRNSTCSPAARRYRRERIAHWDQTAGRKDAPDRPAAFYHALLRRYFRFLVPEGSRVLELGCANGDLLAAVKPSFGVGVDFSVEMIRLASRKHPNLYFALGDVHELSFQKQFDIIILSDLLNDLWDVQRVLENLRKFCHSGTRVVINFYNNLWRIPLAVVRRLGLGAEMLEQNWFSPHDVVNLLQLAGFETVKHQAHILFPLDIPFAAGFANRYLVHLVPFRWFALTNIIVARPLPTSNRNETDRPPGVSVIVPARNEAGNIDRIIAGVPAMGSFTEIIFVEGLSTDQTYEAIEEGHQRSARQPLQVVAAIRPGQGGCRAFGIWECIRRHPDDPGCRPDGAAGGSTPILQGYHDRQGRIHQRCPPCLPIGEPVHAVFEHPRQQILQPGLFLALGAAGQGHALRD